MARKRRAWTPSCCWATCWASIARRSWRSPEARVGDEAAREFEVLVERRASGEPVAYIRGVKEFYGLAFTRRSRGRSSRGRRRRLLVDLALERIAQRADRRAARRRTQPLRIWDVGTGSGAIVVAIAVESRRRGYGGDVRLRATDVSADALRSPSRTPSCTASPTRSTSRMADLTDRPDAEPVDLSSPTCRTSHGRGPDAPGRGELRASLCARRRAGRPGPRSDA